MLCCPSSAASPRESLCFQAHLNTSAGQFQLTVGGSLNLDSVIPRTWNIQSFLSLHPYILMVMSLNPVSIKRFSNVDGCLHHVYFLNVQNYMYQIFTLYKQKLISWKKETWMYRNITIFSECWRHSKWENNLFHIVILLEISLDWGTSTWLLPFTSAHSNVRKHETSCSDSHHRLCQEGCVMQWTPEKHMGQGKWSWEKKLQGRRVF